jgi:4a-hydroxytetrahydrobiopterin dehydratase
MSLAERHCVPCRGGVPRLVGGELEKLKSQISGWQVVDEHHLWKAYSFPDFRTALDFVNKSGAIAEDEGHHPDLFLSWGKVEVKIWTHKIDGLTENDFVLAAKIDQVYSN